MAIVKVWKQGSSLIVTLPAQVCELFKIKEGDELAMDVYKNSYGFKIVLEGLKRIGE
jgi:antitoxin component of MazEF toxin-antitoxin module